MPTTLAPIDELYTGGRHSHDRRIRVGIGPHADSGRDAYQSQNEQAILGGIARLTRRYAEGVMRARTIVGRALGLIDILLRRDTPTAVAKLGALATLVNGLEVRASLPDDARTIGRRTNAIQLRRVGPDQQQAGLGVYLERGHDSRQQDPVVFAANGERVAMADVPTAERTTVQVMAELALEIAPHSTPLGNGHGIDVSRDKS